MSKPYEPAAHDQESAMQGLAQQNTANVMFGGDASQAVNIKNNNDEDEPGMATIN